jgi:O-antigen ligase
MKLNYYHKALIVIAVGIFYTNVPLLLYSRGWTALEAPKHWVILFCLFSLPIPVMRMTGWNVLKSPVTIWCLGYAWLSVLWFFPSLQSDIAWQELRWRFLTIMEILTFLMIFQEPDATKLARKTLVAAVLFGVALNIYELFVPMSFSQTMGRSAGLYQNPNMAGEALVLGMIVSATVLEPRFRGSFILLTGIGIFATLSRAAILMWVIAAVGLLLVGRLRLKNLLVSATVGLLLVVLVLFPRWDQLMTAWQSTGVINVNVQERLGWLMDPSDVSDYSSWERKYVAQLAWNKISEHPVLGSGTGSFHQAPVMPHNQYLAFMLDHGLIGAMILPLFVLAATWGARGEWRGVAIVFGCVMMMLSLFTHTIFNTGYSIIVFSIMAAMAAKTDHYEVKKTMAVATVQDGTAQVLVKT